MLPSIAQLTAAAALLGLASASPVKNGFTVHQVVNRPGIKMSGPYQMAKTYAKFGKPVPDHVAAAAAISTGTVAANPEEFDSEYLEAVQIGTPAQTLNLDFDTGSSDLWVFSSELSTANQRGHSIYTPSKSSTAKVSSGNTWKIQYGDGSGASGNVYIDRVAVGQSVVPNQAVELAQTISTQFTQDSDNDGLLGLAFDQINTVTPQRQKTFFSNAKSQLPSPVFTANLKKGAPGTYDFGFIDSSKYTGSITYVPVSSANGFWEFTGNGYAVGSGGFTSSSIDAIADTGTTLLYLPAAIVTAYYRQVPGATNSQTYGGYVFNCGATLPSITLGIGSYRAVVPGSYINYAPADNTGTTCFGGIQSNAGIGFSIYGDIFLKSQFVVFNGAATPQLGFAAKPT